MAPGGSHQLIGAALASDSSLAMGIAYGHFTAFIAHQVNMVPIRLSEFSILFVLEEFSVESNTTGHCG